jgi:hypothetical protein
MIAYMKLFHVMVGSVALLFQFSVSYSHISVKCVAVDIRLWLTTFKEYAGRGLLQLADMHHK